MLLVPYRQGQMQLFQLAASRLMLASFFHLDWLVLPGTVSACLNSFREWLAFDRLVEQLRAVHRTRRVGMRLSHPTSIIYRTD